MRRFASSVFAVALVGGLAVAGNSNPVRAAVQDGNWSVLVITEKGTCDRAYRYEVTIADGRVRYAGGSIVALDGTVADNGAVKVSISAGENVAHGTGKLSAESGAGTWRGKGSNGTCVGRWEAARR